MSSRGEGSAPADSPGPRRRLLRWWGWFGAANVLLLVLVSLRNVAVTDAPQGVLSWIFNVLMIVGHSALLTFLPSLAIVPLILTVPRHRLVLTLATGTAAALVFSALVDTVIFQQYRFHLNAEVVNLLFGGAAGEILVFSATMYAQAALALVALVGLQTLVASWLWRRLPDLRVRGLGQLVFYGLVAAFLTQSGIHAWADVVGYTPVMRQTRLMPAYFPVTAETLLRRLGVNVERVDAPLLRDHGSALSYPLKPLNCDPPESPPNLLWVIIDSWRFDALDERVTPNIAALAADSLRFTDHLSGGSATRTGLFSMFYGIPGTYWHAMLAEQRGPVLVAEMLDQGFEFGIFASASLVNPEFDRTVFADLPDLRSSSDGDSASARDEDSTADFLEFLEQRRRDRPFFAMLFYDAPHAYDLPQSAPRPFQPSLEKINYLALDEDFDPLPFRNLYLNSVHFNDALVGQVLQALDREGLREETVIVVTGDHGQEFNDNGLNYWGHDSNFSRYQVSVPMIVHWPGRSAATLGHRTSHYDLAPTFLRDLLGCRNDFADHSVGHHLLEPGGREMLLLANYTDYAVVLRDRIVAVYPYGVEILDPGYRPIRGATLDRRVMLEALDQRGRFYK